MNLYNLSLYTAAMVKLQPQTIVQSLMGKIQEHLNTEEDVSDWDMRLLQREADALAKVDPAAASVCRSALAVLQWDIDKVDYWINNSIKLDPSSAVFLNASVTSRLIGKIQQSADYAERAIELDPLNVPIVHSACDGLIFDGRYSRCLELINKIVGGSTKLKRIEDDVKDCLNEISRCGTDENKIQYQLRIVSDLATEQMVRIVALETKAIDDPEGYSTYRVRVRFVGGIEKELELEDALAVRLSSIDGWDPLSLNVEFKYLTKDELHARGSAYIS